MLAQFACDPLKSRGRLVPEPESAHRSAFQRDRDRIIHSTAFRRLKHKTQVFIAHEGDHYRTRLTHTIEVGQVARTIASALGLNGELTEAVALAHDLGHTPFGHVGEDTLADCMQTFGGFDHNAQAIKIVTQMEQRYARFDGLNLTWEALEGIAKHNGPVMGEIPYALANYSAHHDLELKTYASAEAQVAAIADDIAYNNHDLDDGLRAGLFGTAEISSLPLIGPCFSKVDELHPNLEPRRRRHEALRRVFGLMVEDVITNSRARLDTLAPTTAQDIRNAGKTMVCFSDPLLRDLTEIRKFLYDNMYRSDMVNVMRKQAQSCISGLFETFMNDPALLPEGWVTQGETDTAKARRISDYLSGMTDGYALEQYTRLVSADGP